MPTDIIAHRLGNCGMRNYIVQVDIKEEAIVCGKGELGKPANWKENEVRRLRLAVAGELTCSCRALGQGLQSAARLLQRFESGLCTYFPWI
jgi:hypothetical protein